MLDLKLLQRNSEVVRAALEARGQSIDVADFTALDERRRALLAEAEGLKGERNLVSAEVAKRKRTGEDVQELIDRMGSVNARIKELDQDAAGVMADLNSHYSVRKMVSRTRENSRVQRKHLCRVPVL